MEKQNSKKQLLALTFAMFGALIWAMSPFISSGGATAFFSGDFFAASDTVIQASLTGNQINGVQPFGNAEYRFESSRRRFKIDVFQVNLPAGTVLTVAVNNSAVGQITLNAFRSASMDIRTDQGQNVPTISNGMSVTVSNNGTTILSGIFGVTTGSPSSTASPTGTASPSPTGSPNGTPSPTPTANPTASPSPTFSPSPTVSPSPTASPNPTVSPNPTASPSPSPSTNDGDLFARLSGATINGGVPAGFAEFSLHNSGSNRRIRVWVNSVGLPAGTILTVEVANVQLGQFVLQNGGIGEFRIESRDNPIVPVVTAGTQIRVLNGGSPILTGTFSGSLSPSPSPTVTPSPSASPSPTASPSPSPNASPSPSPTAAPNARFFEAELRASQVVPQTNSQARGNAKILVNDAGNQIQIVLSFFGLSSNQATATINGPALPGATGAEIFNLGAIGGTSGFFPTRTFSVTPAQLAQLRAGLLYVQIGSANFPNGEIRGQARAEDRLGDFEGDGLTDLAVFRPSSGDWYFQNSSDGAFRASRLGVADDRIVSGDYDGDGVGDMAMFQNINGYGVWAIRRSFDDVISSEQWGLASDKPAAADFDGDGRDDLAVYRPSSGNWFIKRSSDNQFYAVRWGVAEDIPVAGDYDGDGRADIAVFRPSNGAWYIRLSSNNSMFAVFWGKTGDIPCVGDFDGDGQADLTVFRPSDGNWYIRHSLQGSFKAVHFGKEGDIPIPAEFDGDGITDIAVFRPSTGWWYALKSSSGTFVSAKFGQAGDVPAIPKN